MAGKSAASHTGAAFAAMVAGKLFVEYIKKYFPVIFDQIDKNISIISTTIEKFIPVTFNIQMLVALLVGLLLAFIWGWLYHYVRHDF